MSRVKIDKYLGEKELVKKVLIVFYKCRWCCDRNWADFVMFYISGDYYLRITCFGCCYLKGIFEIGKWKSCGIQNVFG